MPKNLKRNPKKSVIPEKKEFLDNLSKFREESHRVDDLSDKKSARTTFNLTTRAIEAISILTKNYGIQCKDVFDQFLERCLANLTGRENEWGDDESIYQKLTHFGKEPKARKTYVIRMGTLRQLNNMSEKLKIERDMIMENNVIDFIEFKKKSIYKINDKQRNENYQLIINKIWELYDPAEKIITMAESIFGDDDFIVEAVWGIKGEIDDVISEIINAIKKNVPIRMSEMDIKMRKLLDNLEL